MPVQRFDPALLGKRARRLGRIENEQCSGPPADFIIREITYSVGRTAVGRDKLAGQFIHPLLGFWVEWVEPVKPGEATEFEIDNCRKFQGLGRECPAAGAVEAPGEQTVAGFSRPICQSRGKGLPAVPNLAGLLALGIAAVQDIDPKAEKALAAGCSQPRDPGLGNQRPVARRRLREIRASPSWIRWIRG